MKMKRYIIIGIIIGMLIGGIVLATDTLYEYYDTNDDSFSNFYGVNWLAQTFTTTDAFEITSVSLKLYRTGSPGTCTVSIRATSAGKPTGADLTSGTIDCDSITNSSPGAFSEIVFSSGYELSASTQYAIVARATSGSLGNEVNWRRDNSSPTYAGGTNGDSSDSGSSWNSWSADMMFRTYGLAIQDETTSYDDWGATIGNTYFKGILQIFLGIFALIFVLTIVIGIFKGSTWI